MLSDREQQILVLVAQGLSNKQIALHLDISENTVKVHLRNVFSKINVSSRTEASLYALRHGLVTMPTPARPPELVTDEVVLSDAPPTWRWWWVVVGSIVLLFGIGGILYGATRNVPAPVVMPTRWQQLPAVPQPTAGMQFVSYAGALVALAGDQWWQLDGGDAQWRTNGTLPCRLGQGQAWADGTGIWLVGCDTGRAVWHWDGQTWQADTSLPDAVQPQAVLRVDGALWVWSTTHIWQLATDTWQQVSAFPQPIAQLHVVLVDGAVYLFGDAARVWRINTHDYTWQQVQSLPFDNHDVVVSSVLASVLLVDVNDATMWAYTPQDGVVSAQMVPPTVQLGTQAILWQTYVVLPNQDGSAIAAYQAVFQTFVPVLPDP